jgi:glyoxylase-like metal-dependent hydrolase (beta-lactamase superfamily II)
MIEVTGVAQHQAWADEVMPGVEEVRPGLWSFPVPIPNNPLRYVLVYGLELDDGIALVDAGWNTADAWTALQDGLATAGGSITDVRAVLVTHIHPDHYGLAGRVREASGAWIGLHPADAGILRARYIETDELLARMRTLLLDSGVPEPMLPDLGEASMAIRSQVTLAEPDVLLEDGTRPDLHGWDLRAVWTPGHSPGHLCFYDEARRLLLSGDHILPRISPNVSVHSQQHVNPLGDFLEALLKVRDLDVEEVLPAHEYRFRGLTDRVDELIGHHAARLAEIERALAAAPGSTAWELTLGLTWSRPWDEIPLYMQRAANGETLAHLVVLELQERVRREGAQPARWYLTTEG